MLWLTPFLRARIGPLVWFAALLFFLSISLYACATPDAQAIGPYPTNYKEIMKAYIVENYFDPYSMRTVAISAPRTGHLYFQQGWLVCFQANAKNRLGGYVGLTKTAYLINRGRVVTSMEDALLCDQVSLIPWQEMEAQ